MARLDRWFGPIACFAAALGLGLAMAPATAHAGKLSSVRSEVRGSSSSSSGSSGRGSSSSSSSAGSRPSGSSSSGSSGTMSATYVVPVHGPSSPGAHHDHSGHMHVRVVRLRPRPRMLRHPYEARYDGYNIVDDDPNAPGRQFAANLAAEGAWLGDGTVRGAVHARIVFPRAEIDSRTSLLVDTVNGQPVDALYLGDAGLFLIPWRSAHWTIRAGGGVRYMVDGRTPGQGRREYALGWNAAFGFDFFPVRPLVVSYRLDLARLWQATIVQNRATVGAALGPFELYAGYDAMRLGTLWLHGPLVGLRGWF